MESRDTGKSRTSGSGRRLAETAWNTNRKAENSPYAPPPYFHNRKAAPALEEDQRAIKSGNHHEGC
jgi:hypothetical protein